MCVCVCVCHVVVLSRSSDRLKGAWEDGTGVERGVGEMEWGNGAGHTQSEESTDVACVPMLQVDSKNYDDSCPKQLAVTGQTSSVVVVVGQAVVAFVFVFVVLVALPLLLLLCVHIYLCVVAASTSLGL